MHNWLLLYICRKNTYQSAVIRSISQYIAPKFASLSQPQKPEVTPSDPFTHVGLSALGPFVDTRGRSTVKRRACVFTCFSTRAIHIEKLDGLDCSAFINTLILALRLELVIAYQIAGDYSFCASVTV